MTGVVQRVAHLLAGKPQKPKLSPTEVVEEFERQVKELDGLSIREVDEKLGVRTSNRSASGRGYLSPRFYRRIPVQTPERKREEKARQFFHGKDR